MMSLFFAIFLAASFSAFGTTQVSDANCENALTERTPAKAVPVERVEERAEEREEANQELTRPDQG